MQCARLGGAAVVVLLLCCVAVQAALLVPFYLLKLIKLTQCAGLSVAGAQQC